MKKRTYVNRTILFSSVFCFLIFSQASGVPPIVGIGAAVADAVDKAVTGVVRVSYIRNKTDDYEMLLYNQATKISVYVGPGKTVPWGSGIPQAHAELRKIEAIRRASLEGKAIVVQVRKYGSTGRFSGIGHFTNARTSLLEPRRIWMVDPAGKTGYMIGNHLATRSRNAIINLNRHQNGLYVSIE